MKFIEFIDFLGKKPTLLISKQPSHKSLLGGVLSLFTLTAIIFGIGYFAYILFSRESFNLVQNEKLDLIQSMSISETPISANIIDQFGNLIEDQERIFDVSILWYTFKPVFDPLKNKTILATIVKPLPVDKCGMKNNSYITEKNKDIFNEQEDTNGYCIPPGLNVSLTSPVGYKTTSTIQMYFHRCQNISQIGKTNCFPPEVIEEKLSNVWLATFFVDIYFDHNNLENPAQAYMRKEAIPVGASQYIFRDMTLNFKNVDYYSDLNYLTTDPDMKRYNALDFVKDSTSTTKENVIPGSFTSITFTMGTIKQIYNRKYYKLQNMLADLGGLIKALITITLNINLYFSNKTFFNNVIDANINSLYIKSIRKSLLLNVVGGEGKRRGTTIDEQDKNKNYGNDEQSNNSKNEKRSKDNDASYNPKVFDEFKDVNERGQGSPIKLVPNPKTPGSENGYSSERQPIKDEMSIRSEAKHFRSNSNIELAKLPVVKVVEGDKEYKVPQVASSLPLKKNKDVVYKNFKINFFGYIFPGCCFKKGSQTSKQLELHSKFSDIIKGHMDILNISKKLHTVDKLNYILCGDQYKKLLETTINPYLYEGVIPHSSDIYEAREKIISALNLSS